MNNKNTMRAINLAKKEMDRRNKAEYAKRIVKEPTVRTYNGHRPSSFYIELELHETMEKLILESPHGTDISKSKIANFAIKKLLDEIAVNKELINEIYE